MEIRLNIQAYEDRQNIVTALANSGISVRVEKITYLASDTYIVIFNYNNEAEEK